MVRLEKAKAGVSLPPLHFGGAVVLLLFLPSWGQGRAPFLETSPRPSSPTLPPAFGVLLLVVLLHKEALLQSPSFFGVVLLSRLLLCHPRTGTAVSTEPLPLGLAHPEKLRTGQDDSLRLLSCTSGRCRFRMGLSVLGKGKKGRGKNGNGKSEDNATATEATFIGCKAWDHEMNVLMDES